MDTNCGNSDDTHHTTDEKDFQGQQNFLYTPAGHHLVGQGHYPLPELDREYSTSPQ